MRKLRLLILTLVITLMGSVASFASGWYVGPTDRNNPTVTVSLTCRDGVKFDELSFKLFDLPDAQFLINGYVYDSDEVYQKSGYKDGWAVSDGQVYKMLSFGGSGPPSFAEPVDLTGYDFTYDVELIPTDEMPEGSIIETFKHNTAKENITTQYLVNGKKTSKAEYEKAMTGSYTKKYSKKFQGNGATTLDRSETTFQGLAEVTTTRTWSDGSTDTVTKGKFKYRCDEYYTVVQNYLLTYEVVKTAAPAKKVVKKPSTTVVVNVPTVNATVINKALKTKGLSNNSVKTVVLGKNVKRLNPNTFKNYKNAKTITVKTKKLKKATVKNTLKGSKVTTIKVQVGTAKENKKYVKTYKKIFQKGNSGRSVKVS